MWILPSHTSVSAPDTGASTSESDKSLATACERLLTAKSKPSRASYFSRAWKAGNLMRLRSGLISGLSLGKSSPVSRYYRAASPVSRLVPQASALPTPIQDTCSLTYSTGSGDPDLPLFSWRTSKGSSRPSSRATGGATPPALRFCSMSSENWSAWVTEQRRDYSRRQSMRERLTNASECLSWPSVVASEVRQGFQDRSRGKKGSQESLTTVVLKNWPTASTRDHKGAPASRLTPEGYNARLDEAVILFGQADRGNRNTNGNRPESWATPTARDHKSGRGKNEREYKELTPMVERHQVGSLNPRWVEVLMGLPVGWVMPSCACPVTIEPMNSASSETALCPNALPSPSVLCSTK
jgi:hypothetical protein